MDRRPAASAGIGRFLVTRRRCQRSSVAGVTRRLARKAAGSTGASAEITAWSAPSGRGLGFRGRRTAISWRSTSNSASLEAAERASRAIQPARRMRIRHIRRHVTNPRSCPLRDHTARRTRTSVGYAQFWNRTGGQQRAGRGGDLEQGQVEHGLGAWVWSERLIRKPRYQVWGSAVPVGCGPVRTGSAFRARVRKSLSLRMAGGP